MLKVSAFSKGEIQTECVKRNSIESICDIIPDLMGRKGKLDVNTKFMETSTAAAVVKAENCGIREGLL